MKIFAILSILLFVQSVIACPPDVSETVVRGPNGSEQSMTNTFGPRSTLIEAQPNSSIFLELPSTPGTGYSWAFHSATSDESKKAIQSCSFKRFDRSVMHSAPILGAGGSEVWQFSVDESLIDTETGDMTISLAYTRPWMAQDDKPTNTWTVKTRR